MPAKSKKQQKFFGVVRAVQKGEKSPDEVSPAAKKAAKSMSKKDVKDFAKTKSKNLPDKVKKESFHQKLDAILETYDSKKIDRLKEFRKDPKGETPTVEVPKLDDPEDDPIESDIPDLGDDK